MSGPRQDGTLRRQDVTIVIREKDFRHDVSFTIHRYGMRTLTEALFDAPNPGNQATLKKTPRSDSFRQENTNAGACVGFCGKHGSVGTGAHLNRRIAELLPVGHDRSIPVLRLDDGKESDGHFVGSFFSPGHGVIREIVEQA